MISSNDVTHKEKDKNQKRFYKYASDEQKKRLSYDIEQGILTVIETHIEGLKRVEKLKQQLVSRFDWSAFEAFRIIDDYDHKNINADNLRCFLRKYSVFLPEADLNALIALFDQDCDGRLNLSEFIIAMKPLLQFSLKAQNLKREVKILEDDPDDEFAKANISAEMRIIELPEEKTEPSKRGMKPAFSAKTKSTAMTSHHSRLGMNESSHQAIARFTNDPNMNRHSVKSEKENAAPAFLHMSYSFDQTKPEDENFQDKLSKQFPISTGRKPNYSTRQTNYVTDVSDLTTAQRAGQMSIFDD